MSGPYHLGIDVGASRISAATARLARDGAVSAAAVPLGRRSDQAPAVAFIESDGNVLVGDDAQLLGNTSPERLVREFARRVGDDVPLSVEGRAIMAEDVFAAAVAMVVRAVTEREGEPPAAVVVAHPTNWGPHRLGLVRDALSDVGLGHVTLLAGFIAAAGDHDAVHPLQPGQTLAVHDMGGTSYHGALLRKGDDGSLTLLGRPRYIDDVGGVDFDDAVLRHVLAASGVSLADVEDTPDVQSALRQLGGECVDAKESLSFDAQATIPVLLPGHSTAVRLTRSEFEAMTQHLVDRTVDELDAAMDSAGVEPDAVEAILLVGGTCRIPRVAQRLSEVFNRPIAIGDDPGAAVALGAARTSLARAHRHAVPAVVDDAPMALALAGEAQPAAAVLSKGPLSSSPWIRVLSLVTLSSVAVAATVLLTSSLTGGFGFLGGAAPAALLGNPSAAPVSVASPTPEPSPSSSASAATAQESAPAGVDAAPGVPAVITAEQPRTASTGLTPRPASAFVPSPDPDDDDPTTTPATIRPSSTTPATSRPPTTSTPTSSSQSPVTTPTTRTPGTSTPTTQVPDPTTQAPDPTTPAPDPTTAAPDPTTQAPEPTTPAPDPTTQAPEPTTPAPDPTTQAPAPTTQAPEPTQDPTPEPPPPTSPEPVAV